MIELGIALRSLSNFRVHPLGFFYLMIDVPEVLTNRIHVWTKHPNMDNINEVHQHSFDLQSRVVSGKHRNEIFHFSSDSGDVEEFRVEYSKDSSSILIPTGRFGKLNLLATFESIAGSCYSLSAGVLHRVEVSTVPCVTLVTTVERHIDVYSYGSSTEAKSSRRLVNPKEIEEVRSALSSIE